jgi:hypothetical protein
MGKNDVNPNSYKKAGRDPMGEKITQHEDRQEFAENQPDTHEAADPRSELDRRRRQKEQSASEARRKSNR